MRLRLRAPGKLNLALEVLGLRADGFHEIRSVVQTVSLFDALEAEAAKGLSLSAPPELGPARENLAFRAARRLREIPGSPRGAHLRLEKRIPVGVGLGGGSSDAAAALRLLARLWRLEATSPDLSVLAAELGSDVPFFLSGSAALLRGHGEQVEPVPPLQAVWFVLVMPPWREPDKTRRVYAAVSQDDYTSGSRAELLAQALKAGRSIKQSQLVNGLFPAAGRVFPKLSDLQRQLREATGAEFLLAGAGPALFCVCASKTEAGRKAAPARAFGCKVHVVRSAGGLTRICRVRSHADS